MSHTKKNLQDNARYYDEFDHLFSVVSDGSELLNLGCTLKGQQHKYPVHAQNQMIDFIADLGDFQSYHKILDVGCGSGKGAQRTRQMTGATVVGLDATLNHCKYPMGKQTKICADAMAIPLKDATFDRIYCIESAFHYADKAQFIREAHRVLRPGGKLVIADILLARGWGLRLFHKLMKRAVAAATFYELQNYMQDALKADLRFCSSSDISADVRRVFPLWRRAFRNAWQELRKTYSLATLSTIMVALLAIPTLTKVIGLKYTVLIFDRCESTC